VIYWHNKIKSVRMCDFLKVVEFLDGEDLLSHTFYTHHEIYNRYQELRAFQSEKATMIDICNEYKINKSTFYNIKRRFKDN